jgi:hypothetical protein
MQGSAFASFLAEGEENGGLGFSPSQFSYVLAVAGVSATLGIFIYKKCLMHIPWRRLFTGVIIGAGDTPSLEMPSNVHCSHPVLVLCCCRRRLLHPPATQALASCLPLLLIFRLNRKIGLPDIWLALGDEAVKDIAVSFVGMPMFVLMARICPPGEQ